MAVCREIAQSHCETGLRCRARDVLESARGFNAERTSHEDVYHHYAIFQDGANLPHLVLPQDMLDSAWSPHGASITNSLATGLGQNTALYPRWLETACCP